MGTTDRRRPAAAALLACAAPLAQAATWEVEPSVVAAVTFTDNVRLQSDARAESELVLEFMPGVSIAGTGKNFETQLDYRLQALLYNDDSDLNETLNYARADGTVKLAGESLFLDFGGAINQQIINPAERIGISPVSVTNNRTEVTRFNVNPYFARALGKTSSINIGYHFGVIDYDRNVVERATGPSSRLNDNTSEGVTVNISGNPPRSPFAWGIEAGRTRIEYDSPGAAADREVRLQRVGGEFSWLFSNRATLFVGGGDEDNAFDGLLGPEKIDGSFWHAGLRGKLDPVTSYSVSAGEQHFGDSYQASLRRDAKDLTTEVSYLEETTTIGRQSLNYQSFFRYLSDVFGVELPTPGISIYVRKRLSLDTTLRLPQSRWRLNVYSEDRDYLTPFDPDDDSGLDPGSDGVVSAALSWTWTALPRTELSIDAGWQRFELRTSTNNPEDIRLQFRVQRELANDLSLNLRAWRNVRSATVPASEYKENAVSVGLTKTF